jgi:hypothetical protein
MKRAILFPMKRATAFLTGDMMFKRILLAFLACAVTTAALADTKISAEPSMGALGGTEIFLGNQGGVTKTGTAAQIGTYVNSLLVSPPAIGSTTPNTGKFTTVTTTQGMNIPFNWGLPVGIGPSGSFPDAVGTYVIGQAAASSATLSVSATSGSVTATFSAATLLGTASDVGRVITIKDTTYKYCTITAQSSTTVATCTVSGGTLSGTGPFANNVVWLVGTPLTGTAAYSTALPTTFTSIFLWFPANAICASGSGPCASGSAAGVYYATCATTTVCQVFTNTLASGIPVIPGSPTAFSGGNSPGAFNQSTAAQTILTLALPANSLGTQGSFTIESFAYRTNDADTITWRYQLSGTTFGLNGVVSNDWYGIRRTVRNAGATNLQIIYPNISNGATDINNNANTPTYTAFDTTTTLNVTSSGQLSTSGLDWFIILGGILTTYYSP